MMTTRLERQYGIYCLMNIRQSSLILVIYLQKGLYVIDSIFVNILGKNGNLFTTEYEKSYRMFPFRVRRSSAFSVTCKKLI
jgi:hypothetical protein